MNRPFLYILPMRWWAYASWPYFTIGLWLFSFGYLRPEEDDS